MYKRILINFLKDKLLLITIYSVSIIFIILFFHLSQPANSELLYPIFIGLFLLIVLLLIEWSRYYPFNKKVLLLLDGENLELKPITEEQIVIKKLVTKFNFGFNQEINELKENNKERIYLLSHLMHNLKAPVSVIELIVEQHTKVNEEGRFTEAFSRIKQENKRLHNSIEQGLTMIRMESFENDFEPQQVNLLSSLRKVINSRKSEFIYNRVFPVIENEKNVQVITDGKWNEAILEQVISNAIKYSSSRKGNKKIYFKIEEEGDYINLVLKDEGIGIPTYDLDRVFEPFFTGDNGRAYYNSSGIGLYLCKQIATKLGQKITIHSEATKGTEVTIRYLTKL
ncbi:sensor histidine kinase [Halalkalibacter okhensis]|uniref:histidine kinase n=1 Tax=Halalkalibacter okhensis TaxID=333138 RepID=A0A0B0IHT9_9BACI|nr:sensor histidine kinase [Halalkalibacter okhensis]KHF39644.1 histidine kinase [Halalkalibacter okhensis]